MHAFLCVFVIVLFTSQIGASIFNKNTQRSGESGSNLLIKQFNPTINSTCNCHSARNDYTYRYPKAVLSNVDPAFHYQSLANLTAVWDCGLCSSDKGAYVYYMSSTQCGCADAVQRYQNDYLVSSNQLLDYESNWRTTGRWWHCELCIIEPSKACVEARANYSSVHTEIANMDPLFHYITYGYWQPSKYVWHEELCADSPTYPGDYVCGRSNELYGLSHPNVLAEWGVFTLYEHYEKYHRVTGWTWLYKACSVGEAIFLPHYDCWIATLLYWTENPDVFALDLDPSFHYRKFGLAEPFRVWHYEMCYGAVELKPEVCACTAAADLYALTFKPQGYETIYPTNNDSAARLRSQWIYITRYVGYSWHCELCDITAALNMTGVLPKKLLEQETCIAARTDYALRNPDAAAFDPVWHFENIGYYERRFWDGSLCGTSPVYLTDPACANCEAAKQAYTAKYPVARYYANPYAHWKTFYLMGATPAFGYIYPCNNDTCNIFVPTTTTAASTAGVTTLPSPSPTPSIPPTPLPSSTTVGSTSVPTGSTIGAGPTTTKASSTSDSVKSDGDGNALSTTAVLAIVVPIAAVLSVGLGMLFIHQQRRQAVQALIKAEEGERRNYKIDFMSLSIDWLIGSGSFGHVYRGEYRGADVAIKKLKKQNMGNQQLEDFAKEAMVMVGLRHPNIVLFMGVCLERPELCIVTEYMPRGNLYDVLHDSSVKLPFSVVRSMAMHIVKGLQFIHSAGMIHRDLKSPNLLVDANWTIKIADFGLSCAKSQATDDAQISLLWTAPEILMREQNCYSEKSDVYSLGIILWELMSRQTPFSEFTAAAIPPVIVLGKRPPVNSDWNPTFKVLMAQCWGQLPSHRPHVREVRTTLESINHDSLSDVPKTPSIQSNITTAATSYDVELYERSNYPPRGHVTLVFTDVENSAQLWEADPQTMLAALRLLNETCRKYLREFTGYEAQTEGDASMLAFADPVNAVNYCVAVQSALLRVEWPHALLKQNAAKEEWNDQGTCIYAGLRMRMGMHCGEPTCEQDQITYRTEYFGPVVNIASRVTTHAIGGQIIVTADVYNLISKNFARLEPCIAEQMGSCHIKGVHEPVILYQIWPRDLKGRSVQRAIDLGQQHGDLHTSQREYTAGEEGSTSTTSSDDRYAWSLRHNEKWIINYDDLELDVVIGTGSFGDVFAGSWKGQRVAIKQFMKQKVTDEVLLEMRTESGILSSIEHPNIIRFLGMCIKIPHLCIVTELLDRGSLATILLGNEPLSWAQRKNFATDIARGLEYLHKNNIIHRDVKSPNMLVAADWTIKIADFGFSRVKSENHTMTQCGTVAWTAPEIFLGERYSEKADVYSYSVILWELVFRKKPWQGLNSMKVCHSVENGERLSVQNPPSGTPEFMIKLMEACWLHDHERRPSFTEVLHYLEQQR